MKKFLLFIPALCLLFAACKKDNSTPTDSSSSADVSAKIVGKWNFTKLSTEIYTKSSSRVDTSSITNEDDTYYEFKSDGSLVKSSNADAKITYTVANNMLTTKSANHSEENMTYNIKSVTDTDMALYTSSSDSNGDKVTIYLYFTRHK